MNLEFKQAVDECIALMRATATLESCLARYPQYAKDLQPVLRTARNLRSMNVPQERIESVQAGRQRLLSAYAKKAAVQPVSESFIPRFIQRILIKLTGKDDIDMTLVTRFAFALLLVVGVIVGGSKTAKASANSLPGDTLYTVKLSLEDLTLLIANDPQVRQQLGIQYQDTRRQEVQSVLRLGWQTNVQFTGTLSAVNPDSWFIGGLTVKLDSGTQIVGAVTFGSMVYVEGETQSDGTLLARTLTVQGQVNNQMAPTPGSTSMPYPAQGPTQEPTHNPTIERSQVPFHQATPMPSMMPTHPSTQMPTMVPPYQSTRMPTMMPPYQSTSMPTMMSPHGGGMHH